MFKVKRVYERPAEGDGLRVLVDRLWPRGLRKEGARIDLWIKDIGPSDELRRWFGHQVERWPEFRTRYWRELKDKQEPVLVLTEAGSEQVVTLLFGARDEEHNNAVVLKEYLESK